MRGANIGGMLFVVVVLVVLVTLTTNFYTSLGGQLDTKSEILVNSLNQEYNKIVDVSEKVRTALTTMDNDNPVSLVLGGKQLLGAFVSLVKSVPTIISDSVRSVFIFVGVPEMFVNIIITTLVIAIVIGAINWLRGGGRL